MIGAVLVGGALAGAAVVAWNTRDRGPDTGQRRPAPAAAVAAPAGAGARSPTQERFGGYVSSAACLECHREQHASWHRSYHRTMTQYPTPEAVKAPFSGVAPLPIKGGQLELERRDDRFWVTAVERAADGSETRKRHPIGLVTGSHHMQLFWYPRGEEGNTQALLPYAYVIDARRWLPLKDTFLADPTLPWEFDAWNRQCIQCHATAGQPRPRDQRKLEDPTAVMDSRTAELGVACESCHGPGEAHVTFRRKGGDGGALAGRPRGSSDPTVVNPALLEQRRQMDVCVQCHGMVAVLDRPRFMQEGSSYRPGDVLAQTRYLMLPGEPRSNAFITQFEREDPGFFRNHYWPDGTIRTTGREGSGTMRSRCVQSPKFTCLSCHSMHGYRDPDDQLRAVAAGDGNEVCLRCHEGIRAKIEAHTHHPPSSPGSECNNCHMPFTTFGLFRAVRSHQIDSPAVGPARGKGGRPPACNLCHLDRSLGWTAEHLTRWYRKPAPTPPLTEEENSRAAGALLALRGDAVQRVLVAWSMGWPPALAASGQEWQAAYLTLALTDDYAVIRRVAETSLRKWRAFADISYDFAAHPSVVEASVSPIIERWAESRTPLAADKARRVFLLPNGALDAAAVGAQLDRRDNTPIELKE